MPSAFNKTMGNDSFSPMLALGMLAGVLPAMPLEYLLKIFTKWIESNHPDVLKRLSPLTGTRFLICPTDFPQSLLITIKERSVHCALVKENAASAEVIISGPLLSLIDMMDGKVDGDALFFSRDLTVEGDMEALLTLRNAMDSEEIDIRDELLQTIGPFKKPADSFMKSGNKLYQNLTKNMNIISQAITKPVTNRCAILEKDNQNLQNQVSKIEKALVNTQNRLKSINRKIKA